MKRIFLNLLCVLTVLTAQAQKETTHDAYTDIGSVTVFLQGAEITRTKNIQLSAGRHSVTFYNLSPKLDARSVRVAVDPDVSVLAISTKTNYLTDPTDKPRIKQLKDSVKMVDKELTTIEAQLMAYNEEEDLLLRNKSLGGSQTGVSVADLKTAADYFRQRLTEINIKQAEFIREKQRINGLIAKMNSELNELNAKTTYPRNEVTVLLSASLAKNTEVVLKYLIDECGWSPSYDIKATDVNNPVELSYRAKVYNNSDIDWENIQLTLSTGDPRQSAAKPEMQPWNLSYSYNNSYDDYSKSSNALSGRAAGISSQGYYQNAYVEADELFYETNVVYQEVEVSELTSEFKIASSYSIPSNNRPYLVDVTTHSLPADFKYFSVPKMDQGAFLLAKITGWENLDLVTGPASVYFGGSYIGESMIQTRNVKDTLDLSMGRDAKVLVTRTKLTDYSSTSFIGTKRKESYTYEMVVKNNRQSTVEIELQDQIPISQDSDIEVEVIELSGGTFDPITGKVSWKYTLAPGQSQKVKIAFAVKYPKNKSLNIKQSKTRQARMF